MMGRLPTPPVSYPVIIYEITLMTMSPLNNVRQNKTYGLWNLTVTTYHNKKDNNIFKPSFNTKHKKRQL
jgi:hypothetical protein